jgi:hypothetical protein
MTLTQTRATYGLRSTASPTSSAVSGSVQIGINPTTVNITNADTTWAAQALLVGSSSDLVLTLAAAVSTGTTAWTAGSPQVESATVVAAGGATSNGNLAVVVTSAGMTGSPLTVNVPLTTATHTTAALIAQAIVDTLNANATVSARFTASRATAAVKLTRKPHGTYTVGSASVPVYLVGDASEFTIPTALGVTGATSTTGGGADAGVASAGCYLADGDNKDFEGATLTAIASGGLGGFLIRNHAESHSPITVSTAATLADFPLPIGSELQFTSGDCSGTLETITVEPTLAAPWAALVSIIVTGVTSIL